MTTAVTVKGQVTIPKQVRDYLGVGPGSAVAFRRNEQGEIVIEAAIQKSSVSRFEAFRGHAGPGMSTDELMELTRGDD